MIDEDNIVPASEGTKILFFETEGYPYITNKGFIDEMFYSKILSLVEPEQKARMGYDSTGVYIDGNHIVQPQIKHDDYALDSPVFLFSPAHFEEGELESILIESAEEVNRDLVIASSSGHIKDMKVWVYTDPREMTEEDTAAILEKFYQAYKEAHNQMAQRNM